MIINHECVPVNQRFMLMGMAMGFRSLPSLVFMLVMWAMGVHMPVGNRFVMVLQLFGVFTGPENCTQ